ncbi:MAG: ornithine cyclodeaminase family protein, partial [Thermoproteus sp.]
MALFITENDVNELLTYREAVAAVEEGFRLLAEGQAVNMPRRRTIVKGAVLHVLQGAVLGGYGVAGLKAYLSTKGGTRFVVLLFDIGGELLAVIEADRLGQIRTGAASAVATKYMAPPSPEVLGIVGSGRQARSQFEALVEVFTPKLVKIYSRNKEHALAFVELVKKRGFDAVLAGDYKSVSDVDVLATATNSAEPFIKGEYLRGGVHINAVGSNWSNRAEIAPDAVAKAEVIAVDDPVQAGEEAGDLILAGALGRAVPLAEIVAGRIKGRPGPTSITLFKSLGIAVEDLVAAKVVYEKALRMGRGRELPFV